MPSYIRISRIFRDIPVKNIVAGANIPHMRQVVQKRMLEKYGRECNCIKCREIKNMDFDINSVYYKIEKYNANDGVEYFISANIPNKNIINNNINNINSVKNTLIGFLRLRIKNKDKSYNFLKVLENSSIVRELHVYGSMTPTYLKIKKNSQHKGIGKKLLKFAEKITKINNINKITIISGVGVRNYYRKRGYKLKDNYMTKILYYDLDYSIILMAILITIFIIKLIVKFL